MMPPTYEIHSVVAINVFGTVIDLVSFCHPAAKEGEV